MDEITHIKILIKNKEATALVCDVAIFILTLTESVVASTSVAEK